MMIGSQAHFAELAPAKVGLGPAGHEQVATNAAKKRMCASNEPNEQVDIHVDGDSVTNWIMDFYCYPCFQSKELFTFDVGYYKIICSSISVENVEKLDRDMQHGTMRTGTQTA